MNPLTVRPDRLRRLRSACLSLPEAAEKEAWGDPTWRVRDKIFAMQKGNHEGGRPSLWLKAPDGAQSALVEGQAQTFFIPPYVGRKGWVGVYLDTRSIDWPLLESLIEESYRLIAPKQLAAVAGTAPRGEGRKGEGMATRKTATRRTAARKTAKKATTARASTREATAPRSKKKVRQLTRPRHPMPAFVKKALSEGQLTAAYKARPAYQQNDYIGWISQAKQPATQQKRLDQMLQELKGGKRYMNMKWGGSPD